MSEVVEDAGMDGEMDEMEGQDAEVDDGAMESGDEDGDENGDKGEYVRKEFIPNPNYHSETLEQTAQEVNNFKIRNAR